MSTTAPATTNGHSRKPDGVRTYRGRKLEDLIPRIRTELGADAIILREREGLMGGINGFFAQRFVEVEARAGMPRIDLYDESPAGKSFASQLDLAATAPAEPDPAQELDAPQRDAEAVRAPELETPQPDAEALRAPELETPQPELETLQPELEAPQPELEAPQPEIEAPAAQTEPAVEAEVSPPAPEPVPSADSVGDAPPLTSRGRRRTSRLLNRTTAAEPQRQTENDDAGAIAGELLARGVSPAWAAELIGEAAAHHGPFSQASLRDAVRAALAASITRARPLPAAGAAVAFVGTGGAGKTRCVATLAAAYKRGSTLPVTVISLGSSDRGRGLARLLRAHGVSVASVADGRTLGRRVQKGRAGGLVVIDTAAVAPGDESAVRALAEQLAPLGLDAVHIALPATVGAETGKRLLASLARLSATGIAITHADETDQLGVAVELAAAGNTPVSYMHAGLDLERALSATDPVSLAARLLP